LELKVEEECIFLFFFASFFRVIQEVAFYKLLNAL